MKLNPKVQSGAIAAAVAIACGSSVANSASFVGGAGSTLTISRQHIELATAGNLTTVNATVTLGVAHASGDRVRLSINNASYATSGLANPSNYGTVTVGTFTTTVTASTGSATSTATTITTCNVDALSYADGSIANFRVPASGSPSGSVCIFGLAVRTATISSSANTSLTFANFLAGTSEALETAVTKTVITTANQFGAAVSRAFSGVVDVEKDRYHFAADDPTSGSGGLITTGNESQLVISITNSGTSLSTAARVSSVTVAVVGDFSWLDDDGLGTCAAGDLSGGAAQAAVSTNVGASPAGNLQAQSTSAPGVCQTLSYVIGGGTDGLSITSGAITIAVGKTAAATSALATSSLGVIEKRIPAPSTYTASVTFSYYNSDTGTASIGSTSPVSAGSAGAFSLNGSSVNIPFLPYGSGVSRVVYLTNRSSQTGAISVSLLADGTQAACTPTGTVSAKANGVTVLSTLIDEGVASCYGSTFAGKVAVAITSNTPAVSTEVFSGYNRSGSLTTVVNNSNGK